jgi:hypothetical protein
MPSLARIGPDAKAAVPALKPIEHISAKNIAWRWRNWPPAVAG